MSLVTISGILYDKLARTTQNVTLIGDITEGGGPGIPPVEPPQLPGGVPSFPIWGPPGYRPGAGFPDKPGYPSIPGLPDPPKPEPPTGPVLPGHPISGGMVGVYALYWSPSTGPVWVPVPAPAPPQPPSGGGEQPPAQPPAPPATAAPKK